MCNNDCPRSKDYQQETIEFRAGKDSTAKRAIDIGAKHDLIGLYILNVKRSLELDAKYGCHIENLI